MPTSSTHALDSKVLPAVRVPTVPVEEGGEGKVVLQTPIVDLPPAEKFGFAYPELEGGSMAGSPQGLTVSPVLQRNDADISEFESSEAESIASRDSGTAQGDKETGDSTPTNGTSSPNISSMSSPPRLSRAFSMPVPSQLGHLRNPHRSLIEPSPPRSPLALNTPPNNAQLRELSLELADSVQMVIQTLLQISPPHLLDPAKEQFSGCSLSIPSPSISAMLTAMKNLNYMSANISTFTESPHQQSDLPPERPDDDFDIGEMLQSVGDALSGVASQGGVELVLFHADVGMKHISVRNDECGISYALSHIVRQVLDTAQTGDTIEIGLHIAAESGKARVANESLVPHDIVGETRPSSRASSFQPDLDGQLRCTFEIAHKFVEGSPPSRDKLNLDTLFLRRLLRHINGIIREDLQPRLFPTGRTCELSVLVDPGSPDLLTRPMRLSAEEEAMRQPFANSNIQLATEPSLEELLQFVDTLKGKKVALYSSAVGSFAHHLTSYLTAWGLDVRHMSASYSDTGLDSIDELSEFASMAKDEIAQNSPATPFSDSPSSVISEANPLEEEIRAKGVNDFLSFVLIDDDVAVLRSRLMQIRSETTFNLTMRQRPKLAAHHRPKSSPHVLRAKGIKLNAPSQPTSVIIHFTSLSNYKLVKDLIHNALTTSDPSIQIPEIIVLPKPAGPRRVLTALRTAVTKPIVDPFFTPIATSPMSPIGQGANPFSPFFFGSSTSQKNGRPAVSPRTTSDRSSRSSKEMMADLVPRLPPSPLRESDTMEYFTEAAQKLGTSPSSGLVIQSPDGQPAGIFFHPKRSPMSRLERMDSTGSTSSNRMVSAPHLVRDLGNLGLPTEAKRVQLPKRSSLTTEESSTPRPTIFRHRTSTAIGSGAENATASTSAGKKGRLSMPSIGERQGPQIIHTAPSPGSSISAVANPSSTDVSSPTHSPRSTAHVEIGKPTSPPASPGSAKTTNPPSPASRRRSQGRRTTGDPSSTSTPLAAKKANKSVDGNIVPPVKVLIVEDNPINQTILSTFMKKKKIKYDVATNGAEAVEKWKSGGFHLILMDIQMPVMDGIAATKRIRELEKIAHQGQFASNTPSEGQQTPSDDHSETKSNMSANTPYKSSVIIVALTASSLPSDRVTALAAGCNDFLTKPVSLLWLNSKIIEWGSIKALQMWADLRPEVVKSISFGQMTQAREVASKLHVPEGRGRESIPLRLSSDRKFSQEDAIRLLSEAGRTPSTPHNDSHPEGTALLSSRTASVNLVGAPVDLPTTTNSEQSSTSSLIPIESASDDSSRSLGPKRPKTPREISGEEALLAHLKDSSEEAAHAASDVPVLLGEHAIDSEKRSIAEVMHSDTEVTVSSKSSIQLESEGEDTVPIISERPSTNPTHGVHEAQHENVE